MTIHAEEWRAAATAWHQRALAAGTLGPHAKAGMVPEFAGASLGDPIAQTRMIGFVINALPAAIAAVDPLGRLVAINEAWRRLAPQSQPPCRPGEDYFSLAEAVFGAGTHTRLAIDLPHIVRDPRVGYEFATSTGMPRRFRMTATTIEAVAGHLIAIHYDDITHHHPEEESHEPDSKVAAAEDAERRRIGRELHDSTGQYLTAASLDVVRLNQHLAMGEDVGDIIRTLTGTLREASHDLRSFSFLLHPPELETAGLATALRRFLGGFGDRIGLRIGLDIQCQTDQLSREDQVALFRVVQEAMTNAHRHAHASRISVVLRWKDDALVLEVEDDGRGLAASLQSGTEGVGLPGMRARLRSIGGEFELADAIGGGLLVRATLPGRRR